MTEIRAPYPFFRVLGTNWKDVMGPEIMCWRPGTRAEHCAPDDVESVADGLGLIVLTEVSRHKPGKYPERVFYVRQWIDPEGKQFGKTDLRMTTAQAFARLCKGYRHDFEMAGESRKQVD